MRLSKHLLPLLAIGASVLLASLAHAEDLRNVAERLTQAHTRAVKAKDVAALERTLAPGFFSVDLNGKRETRAQGLSRLKQSLAAFTFTTVSAKVVKVTPTANGMIVVVDSRVVGKLDTHQRGGTLIDQRARGEGTWVKARGEWLEVSSRALTMKTLVNGKPAPNGR